MRPAREAGESARTDTLRKRRGEHRRESVWALPAGWAGALGEATLKKPGGDLVD